MGCLIVLLVAFILASQILAERFGSMNLVALMGAIIEVVRDINSKRLLEI